MVMPASGTFAYSTTVPMDGQNTFPWEMKSLESFRPSGEPLADNRLVGWSPRLYVRDTGLPPKPGPSVPSVERSEIRLVATDKKYASLETASYFVDRLLLRALRPGATGTLGQSQQYKLGRPATSEEIRELDISVAPDGSGLPKGSGTVTQGRHDYQILCANCHGDRGQGVTPYPALVGGQGTLRSKNPVRTVGSYWPYATTVWDYIHRTMPYPRPGSLTPDETYAVTAFILYLNGIVDEKAELNEATLPRVKMPNRDGFVPDPRPDVHNKPDQ